MNLYFNNMFLYSETGKSKICKSWVALELKLTGAKDFLIASTDICNWVTSEFGE